MVARAIACLVVIALLTGPLFPMISAQSGPQQAKIIEELCFYCGFGENGYYFSQCTRKTLRIMVDGLDEGAHIVVATGDIVGDLIGIINSSCAPTVTISPLNRTRIITIKFNGSAVDTELSFSRNVSLPQLLDLSVVGGECGFLPILGGGKCRLGIWLNSTTAFDDFGVYVGQFSSSSNLMIANLSSHLNASVSQDPFGRFPWGGGSITVPRLPAGNNRIDISTLVLQGWPQIQVSAEVVVHGRTLSNVRLLVDGSHIEPESSLGLRYFTGLYETAAATAEGSQGFREASHVLMSFRAPSSSTITIDATGREVIDYIMTDHPLEGFKATPTLTYGQLGYTMELTFGEETVVEIGLTTKDKLWFIDPSKISFANISSPIIMRYTENNPSEDWRYVDYEDPLVKAWASQIQPAPSSPYSASRIVFLNLSGSLRGNSTYANFTSAYREYASWTLLRREGICRHKSRAYAAILTDLGIPVQTVTGIWVPTSNSTRHEWNEIFLPGYGWVDADLSARSFARLPSDHIVYTRMTDIVPSLNTTITENPQGSEVKTSAFIQTALDLTRKRLDDIQSSVRSSGVSQLLEDSGNAYVALEQAEQLLSFGSLNEALLRVCEVSSLIGKVEDELGVLQSQGLMFLMFVIIASLAAILVRSWWKRSHLPEEGMSIRNAKE